MRTLASRPGFALLVVLTLAVAIGSNAAMFGVVDATLLTPLPFDAPDRLVRVWETTPEGHSFSASEPNFLDFRERNRSFETLAASKDVSLTLQAAGEPVRIEGLAVSRDYFAVLGVLPALGRGFSADEDVAGSAAAVTVLGHALWTQRFGGDAAILGRAVQLEGRPYTVIGVMPESFQFFGAGFWVPLAASPAADRGDHWLQMIGRLRPGVTREQAEKELADIASAISDAYAAQAGWGVRLKSFDDWLVGETFRHTALLLFGSVALLMLIACANVANVMLAQATRRQGEFGLRTVLGASRSDLVRQLLVEVGLMVGAAVALGLALAHALVAILQRFATHAIPRLEMVTVDERVLAFSVGLGLLTGLIFGVGPVLRASRVAPMQALVGGSRAGVSRGQRRVGEALVVAQVGLALALVVAAGLLFRSLLELRAADTGLDPSRLHVVELKLGDAHAEPWQKAAFFARLGEQLAALPGIAAVGAISVQPFTGNNLMNDVTPVERAAEVGASGFMQAHWRAVTPGFFDAAGVPLLQGRSFDDNQGGGSGDRNVVVSRTFAERMWPGENAVGKALFWGSTSGTPRTVIGVVGDYQDVEAGAEMPPVMFLPYSELPWPSMTLMLRTQARQPLPHAAIRNAVHALAPTLAVPTIAPLQQQLAASAAGPQLRTLLLGGFAAFALLLAAVGVYGVMAASAAQRRRELGLRLALGARPLTLGLMLLAKGMRLALSGAALGLLGAWIAARLLQGLLYGSVTLDATTLLVSTALLALVVLLASGVPALRAARVDAARTLQES
jgi:predicted permease